MSLTVLVLAAGEGTRMKSALPKVLHSLAGRPLVYYPLRAAFDAGATRAVVVSNGRPEIELELRRQFPDRELGFVTQSPARGTGDAARLALEAAADAHVLIVYGDTPLLRAQDLTRLVAELARSPAVDLALLSAPVEDPSGYGRVLRDAAGRVLAVREHRDLTNAAELAVREVNAGVYAARADALREVLSALEPANAQGEYYLTDAVERLGAERCSALLGDAAALVGVNDRAQLAAAEERMFALVRERLGRLGVTVRGDARIDDTVEIAPDALIEAGVRLRGETRIGRGAVIDVGSVLTDAEIGEDVVLRPYSVVAGSSLRTGAVVGPFSHLRPGSVLEEGAHVGNFVETKASRLGAGAKANHLAYLGDADIGRAANIGAGVICCNYDGFEKHKTRIGDRAFVGSDSQLVAPVSVGDGAYVATGTTVTEDVPDDALAIGRVRQENKPGYAVKLRAKLEARKRARGE